MSLAVIDAAIADIKNTPSELIEFQGNSLATALEAIRNELANRILSVADVTALQELDPLESMRVHVVGQGIFVYSEDPYDEDIPNSYPVQGGGSWLRDNTESVATLKDVLLDEPAEAQGLAYNDTDQRWENAEPSVDNVGWDNVTGKPAQISGISATDLLLKHFNDVNKSIGTSESGLGNIRLLPQGTSMTTGDNSTVVANSNILYMTSAEDSILITPMTTLRPGTVPFTVVRSVIIGDPGPLTTYFTGDVLQDVVAIGRNGVPLLIKKADGTIVAAGNIQTPDDVTISGDFAAAGAQIQFPGIQEYANNTDAVAALGLDRVWKDGSGQLFITI